MILETIVTTMDAAGAINFAPMGVEWGEEIIVLKPFLTASTFRNLGATPAAVVEHGYRLLDQFLHGVSTIPRPLPPAADGVLVHQRSDASTLASAPPPVDLVR